ncbi:PE-PPE domain-containing protein [Mycobacterium sp. M1]|uniref:PE-PPE domain-containing protein n=1 Tax=Mycolicibacter acidiphilus TaxID=2835306 RepID=A0ABS5RQ69_9MYCO|nr:PE-PPE domain-containing protein [Mycolicibacter acidiphilus]MBS9535718.1 PE-PPE domain-containing protein [Mycolicibacter acidiphilus]
MEYLFRPYIAGAAALLGAGLATPAVLPPPSVAAVAVRLAAGENVGLVIGGSGTPIPGTAYVGAANDLYIQQNAPDVTYPGVLANGVFTPEGLYPLDGINVLRFNYPNDATGFPAQSTSVGQGLTILDDHIKAQLADHNSVTVFGYSQSATIASEEMAKLQQEGLGNAPVQFVLIGDPSAPNGGILERFSGFETTSGDTHALPLNLPSLGFGFDNSTPSDAFQTAIYSMEYDGFTDFPRYPLNFLADLNAFLGIRTLHGTYLNGGVNGSGPTPEQIAGATLLPGSEHSTTDPCAACTTDYYMIHETAPLVAMLPKPLQDLLGPDLTYLINLGYGDGSEGYSTAPADVATPFGLFPDVSMTDVFNHLMSGAEQGWTAFQADLANPAAMLAAFVPTASDAASHIAATALPSFSDIVAAFTSATSSISGALLGTSDILNALLTTLPTYDLSLLTTNLTNGDFLDAFGLPAAANTAVFTLGAGFELQLLTNTMSEITAAFSGLGL